jgi:hypothetical protein
MLQYGLLNPSPPQVFRSGKMVMGLVEPQLLRVYGSIAFQTVDVAALDAMSAGAARPGAVLCCQLADITPEVGAAPTPQLRSFGPCPVLPCPCQCRASLVT